ncbi:MAG: hypothetical protein EP326_15640 [Deltaproteobacteria bacterium]|nr:MAG: hypothetical protein EP326_15640 [Deltaproteobacteria bacterium]
MKWLMTFLLLMTSCVEKSGKVDFETSILKNVPFALKIDGVFPGINKDLEIKTPPNTWIRVFQAEVPNQNGEIIFHCVYYKVPGKEAGVLRHIESNESCLGNYKSGKVFDWTGINQLKVWLPEFERKIFDKTLKPGRFYLTGREEVGDFFFEVPLFNLNLERKLERHASTFSSRMLKGVFVAKKRDPNVKSQQVKLVGDFEDNYRDRTAKVCHEYSKDCKETTSNSCETCRFGWYSAVGISTCEGQFTRFCGVNKCGQRGMPACPRGIESARRMGLDNIMLCYDGSPLGYCEAGLKTVCDGKILVCL